MEKEEKQVNIEEELKSIKKELAELKKILENHRHDGHGFTVK